MFGLGVPPEERKLVNEYLKKEFVELGGCGECGIYTPPDGSFIEVIEPVQTCHPSSGDGLDEDNRLPVGKYEVIRFEGGNTSHWLHLKSLETDEYVMANCGYNGEGGMDWRKVRKFVYQLVLPLTTAE